MTRKGNISVQTQDHGNVCGTNANLKSTKFVPLVIDRMMLLEQRLMERDLLLEAAAAQIETLRRRCDYLSLRSRD